VDRRVTFPERPAAYRPAVDREHLELVRPRAVDPERPAVGRRVALERPRPAEHSAAVAVVVQVFAAAVEQTHSTR
jgi:hypothetical protein